MGAAEVNNANCPMQRVVVKKKNFIIALLKAKEIKSGCDLLERPFCIWIIFFFQIVRGRNERVNSKGQAME